MNNDALSYRGYRFPADIIAARVAEPLESGRKSSCLLKGCGGDGVAYVLWSLAVEEFGKSLLLRDQLDALSEVADEQGI